MPWRWLRLALVAVISCSLWLGDAPWRGAGSEAEAALSKLKSGMKRKGNRTKHQGKHPRRSLNSAYGNNRTGDRDAYVNPTAKQEYQLGKENTIKAQKRGNSKVKRGKGKAKGKTSRAKYHRR